MEVEMLTQRPRSASLTVLTNSSAFTRWSKTAATVVGASTPSITARKSGVMSRFQCDVGCMLRQGRMAPPWGHVPFPMRRRLHVTAGAHGAAVDGVAQVDGMELERH